MIQDYNSGKLVDLNSIPFVSQNEQTIYNNFMINQLSTISDIVRILQIVAIDGKDLSDMPLQEKYNLLKGDARLDASFNKKLGSYFDNQHIGIKPEVSFLNPITGVKCDRPFLFSVSSILSAIQSENVDSFDIVSDDEH